jgi:hypothetical protein
MFEVYMNGAYANIYGKNHEKEHLSFSHKAEYSGGER